MTDNTSLAREIHEAWNERNFDEIADATAPGGTITIVGSGDTFEGPEGSRTYNSMWAEAFPDGLVTVNRVIGEGEHVVVEFTGRGTHTGTLRTSMGDFPATGRSMTLELCDVMEFEDGKIRSMRSYFDTGSMMAQLGLSPEMKAITQK
ncbi:ester cyclase [Nocardioides sp. MAHUQ-72]|uniref:ester cyclase n=1 Tax=unclassified Nocardioides TaxID=2615069 RepID=UPI003622DF59